MSTCPEYENFSEFYDNVPAYRVRGDVPFFIDLARQAEGPVLEVGCGTGRVLIPTARAGVTIDGLDSAPAMLNICRAALEREPPEVRARVRLHHGDMCAPGLSGPYALITLPFRSFLHILTVEDQLRALSALHALLVPGGRLVLDIFNPSLPYLTDPAPSPNPSSSRRLRYRTAAACCGAIVSSRAITSRRPSWSSSGSGSSSPTGAVTSSVTPLRCATSFATRPNICSSVQAFGWRPCTRATIGNPTARRIRASLCSSLDGLDPRAHSGESVAAGVPPIRTRPARVTTTGCVAAAGRRRWGRPGCS